MVPCLQAFHPRPLRRNPAVLVFVRVVVSLALVGAGLVVALTGDGAGVPLIEALLIGAGLTTAAFGAFLRGVAPGRPAPERRREGR
jgi:hypothetical protein